MVGNFQSWTLQPSLGGANQVWTLYSPPKAAFDQPPQSQLQPQPLQPPLSPAQPPQTPPQQSRLTSLAPPWGSRARGIKRRRDEARVLREVPPQSARRLDFSQVIVVEDDDVVVEKKVKPEDNKKPDIQDCVVCMAQPSSHVLIPCMHFCLCESCALVCRIKKIKCPKCRSKVTKISKVFF